MAAFVIALGLAVGWCTATIIAFTPATPEVNVEGANLLNGVGQVLAGALATFLGTQVVRPKGEGTHLAGAAPVVPPVEASPGVGEQEQVPVPLDTETPTTDADNVPEPED